MNSIDPKFAAADVLLRSGGQVNRSDYSDYEYITHQLDELQRFYAGYQASLIHHPDGFFFLHAQDGVLPTRVLPRSTMHMGQFICLKLRHPDSTRSAGVLSVHLIVHELESSLPRAELLRIYAPKNVLAVAPSRALDQMHKAINELARLRFVRKKGDALTPLESIRRFAELARHGNDPDELGRLALQARGVILDAEDLVDEGDPDDETEAE